MDRAAGNRPRRRKARAAARRGNAALEAALSHPIFAPLQPWLAKSAAPGQLSLEELNRFAEAANVRVASGKPLRFVHPDASSVNYEVRAFQTGCVQTRGANLHDYFNALAWLAFPRTKARLNALHAAAIPGERGRRGRLRDLLTLFDEGGAIVECDDPELVELMARFRWKELFWCNRERVRASMKVTVLGHAVLEKALQPWPGITCKALFIARESEPDIAADQWLSTLAPDAEPRQLQTFPVFGYPGWHAGSDQPGFYEDTRYFRPFRRDKMRPGVGRAAAASRSRRAEESPGSTERDAG